MRGQKGVRIIGDDVYTFTWVYEYIAGSYNYSVTIINEAR